MSPVAERRPVTDRPRAYAPDTAAPPPTSVCTTVPTPIWTGPTNTPTPQLAASASNPAPAHPQRNLGMPASTAGGTAAAPTLMLSIRPLVFRAAARVARPHA